MQRRIITRINIHTTKQLTIPLKPNKSNHNKPNKLPDNPIDRIVRRKEHIHLQTTQRKICDRAAEHIQTVLDLYQI